MAIKDDVLDVGLALFGIGIIAVMIKQDQKVSHSEIAAYVDGMRMRRAAGLPIPQWLEDIFNTEKE